MLKSTYIIFFVSFFSALSPVHAKMELGSFISPDPTNGIHGYYENPFLRVENLDDPSQSLQVHLGAEPMGAALVHVFEITEGEEPTKVAVNFFSNLTGSWESLLDTLSESKQDDEIYFGKRELLVWFRSVIDEEKILKLNNDHWNQLKELLVNPPEKKKEEVKPNKFVNWIFPSR